ncbi:c-type cytochrome [Microbulbifer guangxiensis]|uniref:c-type cytochrome n=1 Tax=Microbulbifer guangxiensis TaxID=2904249 RepID=UPI0034E1B485
MALVVCAGCSPQDPELTASNNTDSDAPAPAARETAALYQRTCFSCHSTGINGAPRTGDQQAWATRMDKGMEVLVRNARDGYQAMPPRGLCFDCSDEEYGALIRLMAESAN